MTKLTALAVLQDPDFRIVHGPASPLNLGADGPYAYASARAIAQHAAATWLLEYGIANCDINDVDPSDFGGADCLTSAFPVAYVDADSDPMFDRISIAQEVYFSPADLGPNLWAVLDHWASGIISEEGAFAKLQEFANELYGQDEEDDPYPRDRPDAGNGGCGRRRTRDLRKRERRDPRRSQANRPLHFH